MRFEGHQTTSRTKAAAKRTTISMTRDWSSPASAKTCRTGQGGCLSRQGPGPDVQSCLLRDPSSEHRQARQRDEVPAVPSQQLRNGAAGSFAPGRKQAQRRPSDESAAGQLVDSTQLQLSCHMHCTHLLVVGHWSEVGDVGKALGEGELRGAAVQRPLHQRVVNCHIARVRILKCSAADAAAAAMLMYNDCKACTAPTWECVQFRWQRQRHGGGGGGGGRWPASGADQSSGRIHACRPCFDSLSIRQGRQRAAPNPDAQFPVPTALPCSPIEHWTVINETTLPGKQGASRRTAAGAEQAMLAAKTGRWEEWAVATHIAHPKDCTLPAKRASSLLPSATAPQTLHSLLARRCHANTSNVTNSNML